MSKQREQFTQFDYLLNAYTAAAQADRPADHDYATKRQALYAYVRRLEATAAAQAVPDDERKANRKLRDEVWNLMCQKGRHNTEIAYHRLERAYLEAVKASPAIAAAPTVKEPT